MSAIPAMAYSGIQAASGIASAFGAYQQGKQEQQAYNQNAEVSEQSAEAARVRAKLNEYQKQKVANQQIGTQRAVYAKSGVNINTGSPIDVMIEDLSNAYLDIEIDNYNNEVAARGFQSEADNLRFYGKQAKNAGMGKAGLTLLQTAGNLAKTRIGEGSSLKTSTSSTPYYPGYRLPSASVAGQAR